MQEHAEPTRGTKMAQENNTHELRHVSGHYQSCRWARIDPVHSPHRLFPQSPPEMATRTFLAESDKDLPNQVSPEPILPGSCRVQSHPGHQNILLCCCRVGQLAPDTLEHKQEAQTWTGNGGQTRSGTITWLLAGWRTTCSPLQHVSVLLTQNLQRKDVLVPASCTPTLIM